MQSRSGTDRVNRAPESTPGRPVRLLALVSALGFAYFTVSLGALHLLRSDYDPVGQTVSQYAVGPYGYLITISFFALGPAVLALAVGLVRGVSPPPRVAAGFLAVAGVAVIVVGVFPVDRAPSAMPLSEMVHDSAYMASFVATLVAMIVLTAHLKRDRRWRSVRRLSLVLAVIASVDLAAFVTGADAEWRGIVQRLGIGTILAWLLLMSARLRSVA